MKQVTTKLYALAMKFRLRVAHWFVPLAPSHLQLTDEQVRQLDQAGVERVLVQHQAGHAVLNVRWKDREMSCFLTRELLRVWSGDVIKITRNEHSQYEVRTGACVGQSHLEPQVFEYINYLVVEAVMCGIDYQRVMDISNARGT